MNPHFSAQSVPANPHRASPIPLVDPPTDREYQIRGVRAIVAGLHGGGRGQLRAACGTGKTKMSLWAAERLVPHGGVVVIAVPTIGLVAQTLTVWAEQNRVHRALAVCGDTSVLEHNTSTDGPRDELGDLDDITEPVTTDPDMVDAWLRTPCVTAVRLIVVTHASCHVVGEGLQKAGHLADLLIVDEAHRSAGVVDKHTALVHDDDVLPAQRRLYMTATPRIARSSSDRDIAAYSMDDEHVYGPVLFNYPFSEAIADGWLDDYQVAVIGVTHAEALTVLRHAENHPSPNTGRRVPTLHAAMVQAAVARAAAQFGLRRVIAFCPRVNDAKHFAATFPQTLKSLPEPARPTSSLTAAHIDGTMNHHQRRTVLELLQQPPAQGWTVVANAKCLSEGIDVPAVDGIAFTAPKKSPTDIVQAVGRALRRDPDGTGIATIIVPILLADDAAHTDGGFEAGFDAGAYEVLWEVVSALRAHDDTFGDALDACRASGFQTQGVLDRFRLMLPDAYRVPHFLEHLTIRLVKSATSRWWDGYRALVAYYEQFGHALVPQRYSDDDEFKLGQWVTKQRGAYKQGRLGSDRVEALEKVGLVYDPYRAYWEANLAALTAFREQHGHLDVPAGVTSAYGTDLRQALTSYRGKYRQGVLPVERAQALDKLGIDWDLDSDVAWARMIATLRAYHAEHGDLLIPPDLRNAKGAKVQSWMTVVRKRKASGDLSAAQVAELDALDMLWDAARVRWARQLKPIREHHNRCGSLRITPADVDADPAAARIRTCLVVLRRQYQRNELADFQVADLDAMGIDWDMERNNWDTFYQECLRYHKEHGNLRINDDFVTESGIRLGRWLYDQKLRQFRGRLSEERVAHLESLGIEWRSSNRFEVAWDRSLRELDAHCQAVHCTPDDIKQVDKTVAGYRIGVWLSHQRQSYRKGRLAASRIEDLASRGVTLAPSILQTSTPTKVARSKADSWAVILATLRDAYGDGKIISRDTDLGRKAANALSRARAKFAAGKLTAEQIADLDAMDIEWRQPGSSWREGYLVARQYYRQTGNLIPTVAHRAANGTYLDSWLRSQRSQRSAGTLSEVKIAKLDTMGMVWDLDRATWERGLAAAACFRETFGHLNVPRDRRYDGIRGDSLGLYDFLKRQRSRWRDGALSADRVAALDALGIHWAPQDAAWDAKMVALTRFRNEYGHLLVPEHHVTDGLAVGNALHRIRRAYAAGTVPKDRVEALEQLGIIWDIQAIAWGEMIDFLRRYHDEHGDIRVPQDLRAYVTVTMKGDPAPAKGVRVAGWIVHQRQKREKDLLTEAQIADLDALGMAWEDRADRIANWKRFYAVAESFFRTHGHLNVPRNQPTHRDFTKELDALYTWLRRQRAARTDGTLSEDQIAALNAIGMQWTATPARDTRWMTALEQVKEFHSRHGHFPRGTGKGTSPEFRKLTKWLQYQRSLYTQGKLRPDRARMLTDIGYDLSPARD